MFRAAVASAPTEIAIHYFDAAITWSSLDDLSDSLAVAFQDLGVKRGDRVTLFLQNVPQFVVAMVAAWKAGAAMHTVNPMMKPHELAKQLEEIRPRVLVSLESLYADVVRHIAVDTDFTKVVTTSELDFLTGSPPPALIASTHQRFEQTHDLVDLVQACAGRAPELVELAADELAQIMYTSGSTGLPKAAMSTHGNVVFNSHAYRQWLSLGSGDVCIAAMPLVHVTGPIGYLGASMAAVIPVVLMYRFDPRLFLETVERHRVTYTVLSPTGLAAVMAQPESHKHDISSLTKLLSGQVEQTMEAWERRFGVYVSSIYGATECTSPTHIEPLGCRAPIDAERGKRAVGVPIYNTSARIVNDDGADVPVGELGEIVVSGPQVGLGYWNCPGVASFRNGVYFTGDIGYMDEDGWFFIVGRKKDMIDASGFKISPLEIENVLYDHPAVREAAVIGIPDSYRGETVKAFVALRPGCSVAEAELIAFCRERMAAYKYPRIVEIWDDLPKSDIGKIAKSRLPRE